MSKNFAIAGSLDFISLSEVFQLLGTNSSTGILRVISRYNENPGIIYFLNGEPIDANCGPLSGLDAVFPLFGWIEGEFEFSLQSVKNKAVIKKNRTEIVLEGMKMLDDGTIVKQTPVYYDKNKEGDSDLPIVRGPLVDYMYVADEEDYRDGETVIKQGKHGDWSWVILAGILEIRKETPNGQIPILRLGSGSFIGSIAAYQVKNTVRTYSVVTVGEVQLGVLDSQRLSQENAKFSGNLKRLVISLERRLKQCSNRLADLLIQKEVSTDPLQGRKQFIKQGEKKEEAYTVDHGSAYIVRKTDKGQTLLARLEDNDFLGKIPFLNMGHEPHSASVYASEDLKLKPLDLEALQKEYERLSTTIKNMIENNASIISALTMQLTKPGRDKNNEKTG